MVPKHVRAFRCELWQKQVVVLSAVHGARYGINTKHKVLNTRILREATEVTLYAQVEGDLWIPSKAMDDKSHVGISGMDIARWPQFRCQDATLPYMENANKIQQHKIAECRRDDSQKNARILRNPILD